MKPGNGLKYKYHQAVHLRFRCYLYYKTIQKQLSMMCNTVWITLVNVFPNLAYWFLTSSKCNVYYVVLCFESQICIGICSSVIMSILAAV